MAATSSLSVRPTTAFSSPLHLHSRPQPLFSIHLHLTSLTLKPANLHFSSNLTLSPLPLHFPLYISRFSSAIDDVLGQFSELSPDPEQQRVSGGVVDGDESEGSELEPVGARRLYVGNLPYSVTSNQLAEVFGEAGQVRSVEIIYDRVTDRSRGFGFVTMGSVKDANNAIRMLDGSQIGGRTLKVNLPEVPKGGERKVMVPKMRSSYQKFVDTPHKLYVGNLGWSVTSEGLRDAFVGQPGFVGAKVIYEWESGRSRGYGFVTFASAEEAEAALAAMNGVEVEGRSLRLHMAVEKARSHSPPDVDLNSQSSEDQEFLSSVTL